MKTTKIILIMGAVILVLAVLSLIHRGKEGFANPGGKFVMYYAEWCPHCKIVKPDFKKFSKGGSITINGKSVGVAMVEESDKKNTEGKPIKGFPTFLYESADGQITEYNGPRTPDGWKAFLTEQVK